MTRPTAPRPAISVVVAVPEPATRLPIAVASVLGQSLRGVEVVVVDATSTGDSETVIRRLAADPRVRHVPISADGAGPGRARNAGLAQADGEFVLFLDAHEQLDRHGCRALLAAAADTGADVVAGRRAPLGGRDADAGSPYDELFRRTATWSRLTEHPELLYDTVATNTLYRREFLDRTGLTFAEGNLVPDLSFLPRALTLADGVAVIPQCTGRYLASRAAATAARDARTCEDRLAMHRDADAFLTRHGTPSLRAAKDAAFLRIELPRYLRAATRHSSELAAQLLAPLRDYLSGIDPHAYDGLDPMLAIAAFLVGHDDADGARSVVDHLSPDRRLTTRLAERDGRVFWVDRHLDTDEGRRILDVTRMGFQELAFAQLPLESRVDELTVDDRTMRLRGQTLNQLGRVPPGAGTDVVLSFVAAGTARRTEVPVTIVEHTTERLVWTAAVDLPAVVRPTWRGLRRWNVRLVVSVDGERSRAPVSVVDPAIVDGRVLMRRLRWAATGNRLSAAVTRAGGLALVLSPDGRVAAVVARVASLLRATRVRRGVRRLYAGTRRELGRVLNSADTKSRVYRTVFVRLPLQRRRVVFESHMGQSYSDNPRYVFEELLRRDAGFDVAWSFAGPAPPMPAGVRVVRRNSWRYFLTLARAAYWVDNQGLPGTVTKPARTTYLQTWHGSALKRMGEDTPGFRRLSAAQQARHRAGVARWDYFVARTEHDVRTLVPALHVRGEILRTGYPRNDPLVHQQSSQQRAAVRRELGLPDDAVLVLYAPTFRETYAAGRQQFSLEIDLDRMHERLPDHLLLLRTHYLQRLALPAASHAVARDVSHLPDITPLLVAADVLVTDYSSVMFDFANTGRPMVFFAYDYDNYANSERGVYFELAEQAPGPLVRTSDELVDALATLDRWRDDFAGRYASFVRDFGEYDTGSAARQVVDRVFFGSRPGRGDG